MIKRQFLTGIDQDLYDTISNFFTDLEDRAMYAFHLGLLNEMKNTFEAPHDSKNKTYRLEFERMDDVITIKVSPNTLYIDYSGIDTTSVERSTYPIYSYDYVNAEDEGIKVEEHGSYFIFCEKLSEHVYSIEINEVKIKEVDT